MVKKKKVKKRKKENTIISSINNLSTFILNSIY